MQQMEIITDKVIDDIGPTVIKLYDQHECGKDDQERDQPTDKDKHCADFLTHDGQVMQGLADGYIAIIGHGSQKVKFGDSKENDKK